MIKLCAYKLIAHTHQSVVSGGIRTSLRWVVGHTKYGRQKPLCASSSLAQNSRSYGVRPLTMSLRRRVLCVHACSLCTLLRCSGWDSYKLALGSRSYEVRTLHREVKKIRHYLYVQYRITRRILFILVTIFLRSQFIFGLYNPL